MDYSERLARLRKLMAAAELKAVAFVPGPNLVYLAGINMHLSQDRPLTIVIPAEGDPTVITPQLEAERFDHLPFSAQRHTYTDEEGFLPAFEIAAKSLKLDNARVGVEGLRMRVLERRLLERYAPGCTVFSADDALAPWRLHKTPEELASMRKAIALSQ